MVKIKFKSNRKKINFFSPINMDKHSIMKFPVVKNKPFAINLNSHIQPNFFNANKYPTRSKAELRLIDKDPWGDKDRDRVPNFFDCKPLNRKKQGMLQNIQQAAQKAGSAMLNAGASALKGIGSVAAKVVQPIVHVATQHNPITKLIAKAIIPQQVAVRTRPHLDSGPPIREQRMLTPQIQAVKVTPQVQAIRQVSQPPMVGRIPAEQHREQKIVTPQVITLTSRSQPQTAMQKFGGQVKETIHRVVSVPVNAIQRTANVVKPVVYNTAIKTLYTAEAIRDIPHTRPYLQDRPSANIPNARDVGQYNTVTQRINLDVSPKDWDTLSSTYAHEIGHRLDYTNKLGNSLTTNLDVLKQSNVSQSEIPARAANDTRGSPPRDENIATQFAKYTADPYKFKQQSPQLAKTFETALIKQSNPINVAIDTASDITTVVKRYPATMVYIGKQIGKGAVKTYQSMADKIQRLRSGYYTERPSMTPEQAAYMRQNLAQYQQTDSWRNLTQAEQQQLINQWE
jgi:hypothetical protein